MADQGPQKATREDAYRELQSRFGRPRQLPSRTGRVHVYSPSEFFDGTGIVLVRHSTEEDGQASGARPMGQLKPVLDYLARHERQAKHIVVTWGLSGALPLRERTDLGFALDTLLREGWPEFFAFREVSRMARDVIVGEQIRRLARDTQVELIMADTGPMTTDQHAFLLQILIAQAQIARDMIRRASADGKKSRLSEGEWPKGVAPPYGTIVDESRKLQPDHERLALVKRAVQMIPERSQSDVVEALRGEGGPSERQLRAILESDRYVTGEFVREYDEVRATFRVAIPRSVKITPEEMAHAVDANNRRKASGRPQHLLSGVPIYHFCSDETLHLLYLKPNSGGSADLRHRPATPPTCKGWKLDANQVLRAVCAKLIALAYVLPGGDFETKTRLLELEAAEEAAALQLAETTSAAAELMRRKDAQRFHEEFEAVVESKRRAHEIAKRKLDAAKALPAIECDDMLVAHRILRDAFDDLLTRSLDSEPDSELVVFASRVLDCCVSGVVVFTEGTDSRVEFDGPLVAREQFASTPVNPVVHVADVLIEFLIQQRPRRGTDDVVLRTAPRVGRKRIRRKTMSWDDWLARPDRVWHYEAPLYRTCLPRRSWRQDAIEVRGKPVFLDRPVSTKEIAELGVERWMEVSSKRGALRGRKDVRPDLDIEGDIEEDLGDYSEY